ncbi:hypothetical protein Dimus_036533, partial [Dionaea muscipula]
MTVIHLKKKDVVKSKVRGVEVEFDHEKLATILGIHRNNGMLRGEYGSGEKFYDARMRIRALRKNRRDSTTTRTVRLGGENEGTSSRPLGSYEREKAEFTKFRAEFERKRANKFHDDAEKAKARMPGLQPYSLSSNQTPSLAFLTHHFHKNNLFCIKP